jgi:hypothetical protein
LGNPFGVDGSILPSSRSTPREFMTHVKDDPPGEALRRLIGSVELMPFPGKGDLQGRLFEARERFIVLRRLGVESLYLADQARRVDSSLLLEVGAITTNRLIALAEALSDGSLTRQGFFALMHSQVESHRERDATWWTRASGVKPLALAQSKIDSLERSEFHADAEGGTVPLYAVGCAVYIAFFLEAWWRRHE